MKIGTKLKLAALVPAFMALVVGVALFFSFRVVQEAERKDRAVQQIITDMNELNCLVGEYILYREDRPLRQFLAAHNAVMQSIDVLRFAHREQQKVLSSIRRDMESMKGSFLKLVQNHERYGPAEGDTLIKEVENRLAGRLMVWLRDVVSDASYLEKLVDEQLTAVQGRIHLLIFALIVVSTVFLTILLMGVTRHITGSLRVLRKGTEWIGSGDLEHRIGMSARDEIGELSQAFDRMTTRLQVVTVSKNALQQEVEERKKAETALREQSEWFRVTLASIGDAVIATDIGGRIDFLNPVASTLTGWPSEEAHGRPIGDVMTTMNEFTREPVEDIVKRVLAEGCVVNMANHTVLVRRDGSEIQIEDSAAPIKDTAADLLGVVIVFHDVTEKKRAQEALRRSEEHLRIVADFTYDWEYWRSPENRFLYVSPSCERVTGYSREEFFEAPDLFPRIVHPEDRGRVSQHMTEGLLHQEPCELEYRIIHRDGRERWIGHACQAVLDDKGSMLGRRACNRDITERKRAEQELEKSRDELEGRVRERTAELEIRNKELQDFAFIAAHDLREPLRKIQSFGDMLARTMDGFVSEKAEDYVRRMQKAAARMQQLLDSLLAYSRVNTKSDPMKKADLNRSVKDALSNLEIAISEKNARIEVGDLPEIEADRIQVVQLFQNLVGNALKFSREGEPSYIRIHAQTVADENAFCTISVEDNGIGFDEQYLERIFSPFQRLHGRSDYEGVGMGLAICRKIVERHGGNITARSRLEEGSTFIVTLPIRQDGGMTGTLTDS